MYAGEGGAPLSDASNPRARAYAMFRLRQAMQSGQFGQGPGAMRGFEQASMHPQQWWRQYSAGGHQQQPSGMDAALAAAMQARGMGQQGFQGAGGVGQQFDMQQMMQKMQAAQLLRSQFQQAAGRGPQY